ncbi:ABC dipeptide/oligopeptide/nickel transport, ATPase component [Legionella birminghamensis]|uniref:ABC-type dipeptide transporter n=1 Tax=Legionella birminghamensis TaxID=28083 RepID=A0A378IB07_9GAMM|nr:dipeptide ABC transporter ATP-binding protein [Legionella birminghamensis]KTC73064.1 ABC dipeptide/oligopeptide/nickel transport, ATPase component [Legionella birminghamensis]STX32359.1 ABC dipeptide/oligopeptide/nickel transport, ATPase component [Legionella birminghamensis]
MNTLKAATEVKDLSIYFEIEQKTTRAVERLDFSLLPGKTLALLGESGCGKSITALGLMRLLPTKACYGGKSQILIENQDILDLPEKLMRALRGKRLAMIFQEPMTALNPVLRIDAQLAEAVCRYQRISGSALRDRLIDLLKEVEIPDPELRLQQYPHQLSGGQKQRIVIAMALANQPEILIADEPTTALDVTIQAQILSLLKKLQQQRQMSMLLITHDLGVVKAVADHVCVMYAGQLVEAAPVKAFFMHLKHPYSRQLMASLPDFEKRHSRLQTIAGAVPSLDDLPSGCLFHPRCAYAFDRCRKEVPVLQQSADYSIRCHLYPELQELPPLKRTETLWSREEQETPVCLSVNDLSVYFKLGRGLFKKNQPMIKAVDGLSLDLHQAKTLALVGESGCGKTTVCRSILKLQPVTSGEIRFKGDNIHHFNSSDMRDYRKKLQIVFQDPFSSLNPRMTVGEIIAEGMIAQGLSKSFIQSRQQQLLEQVNLPRNCLNRYPHQFSGGQRQRVCIARALATEPEILICDEPTSALDVSVQAQILNLLKELQYELGVSYLFITHNMSVVSYIADEVLVMRNGKEVERGSVEQIMKFPREEYTRKLLDSVLS